MAQVVVVIVRPMNMLAVTLVMRAYRMQDSMPASHVLDSGSKLM
jgi:hypothetical protein